MSLPWDPDERVARAGDAIVPRPLDLRASDAEREQVAQALREHAEEGRLDDDELEERLGLAYQAPRRADLADLLGDLPAARAPRTAREAWANPRPPGAPEPSSSPEPLERMGRELQQVPRGGWVAFGVVSSLLVVVWATAGFGAFWPAWILLFWAFMMLRRGRGRRR